MSSTDSREEIKPNHANAKRNFCGTQVICGQESPAKLKRDEEVVLYLFSIATRQSVAGFALSVELNPCFLPLDRRRPVLRYGLQ
jgi:hypothetical protein